jgi:hypothetical protein
MYLDNDAAVAAGTLFGYQKKKAWLEWKGDEIRVYSEFEELLLEGTFEWGSPWYDAETAVAHIPNFADMVSIMTTRILGKTNGVPICSHFEWNLRRAKVAAVKGSYSMKMPFREDMDKWPYLSPFSNSIDGAIVVRGLRWRLANHPEFCS